MKHTEKIIENIEHLKFDEAIVVKRKYNYERAIKSTILGLGILSFVLSVLLLASYLFVGTAKVFAVKFSLPAIGDWLLSLPDVKIVNPEGMLARLFIGIAFFFFYIIIAINIIVKFVKIFNRFKKLCDISNSNIDHKNEFLLIVKLLASQFAPVIALSLLSITTTGQISIITIILIVLYSLYFIAINVAHDLYYCYDVNENILHKNQLIVNIAKRIALLIVAFILVIVCLKPHILTFTNNIIINFNNPTDYKGFAFIKAFIIPWIKWLMCLSSVNLLGKALNLNKVISKSSEFNFYATTFDFYETHNDYLRETIKSKAKTIIFYTVVLIIADLLFIFFNNAGTFSIPSNLVSLLIGVALSHLPRILLTSSVRIISKVEEKELVNHSTTK